MISPIVDDVRRDAINQIKSKEEFTKADKQKNCFINI